MQGLEIVKPRSDACETGLRWEGLQAFNGADVASLVLCAECPPRFQYVASAAVVI